MTFDPKKLAEGITDDMRAEETIRMTQDKVAEGSVDAEWSAIATMAANLCLEGTANAMNDTLKMLKLSGVEDKISDRSIATALIVAGMTLTRMTAREISKKPNMPPPVVIEKLEMLRALQTASVMADDIVATIAGMMRGEVSVGTQTLKSGVHLATIRKSDLERQPKPEA